MPDPSADRSVLHVLPHPGGGGDTYVDLLSSMRGYRFELTYLTPSREHRWNLLALISGLARVARVARRFDVIHVHGEVTALLCLLALATRASVVSLHGLNFVRRSKGLARRIALANLKLVVATANRTICVSKAEYQEVLGILGKGAETRVSLVPNGVSLPLLPSEEERCVTRTEMGLEGRLVVLWIGSLDYPKDPVTPALAATEAADRGVPVLFLVIGKGGLEKEIEQIARSSHVVRLLGERDDVNRLLAAADAFVLTSYHEGLPFSLLEAMASAVVPIVSSFPGARDIVDELGIVVPHGAANKLMAAFAKLAGDEDERKIRGIDARERIRQRYSLAQMVSSTRAVYEAVLDKA